MTRSSSDGDRVDRPIFIIGCGRSGTTLLYQLLSAHRELAWFSNYTQRWPSVPALAVLSRLRAGRLLHGRARIVPRPTEGHAIWDSCRPPGAARNEPLSEDDLGPDETACLRHKISTHVRLQGGSRFINKNTRNTRRIRYLHRLFPDAYFVHLVRDPRATVASLLRVAFWPDLEVWWQDNRTVRQLEEAGTAMVPLAAEFWCREVGQIDVDRVVLDPDRYLEVTYEDLVRQPTDRVVSIADFAGLPRDPAFIESLRRRPVRATDDKYRDQLSIGEIDEIERITAPVARRHGYLTE